MHHNITAALADVKTSYARLCEEMTHLSPRDIAEAFANNGYDGMRPKYCRFERQNATENGTPQWVYDCTWEGDDIELTADYRTNIYVSVKNNAVIADV